MTSNLGPYAIAIYGLSENRTRKGPGTLNSGHKEHPGVACDLRSNYADASKIAQLPQPGAGNARSNMPHAERGVGRAVMNP